MKVDILQSTDHADRLACLTARGDYMEDSLVGVDIADNDQFDEIMEGVEIKTKYEAKDERAAKMYSFIEKLIKRGHYGPFEHPSITFAVEGISRSCMAQLTRHRHVSFDVQSMRYVNVEDATVVEPESVGNHDDFRVPASYRGAVMDAFDNYEYLIEEGVPKEDARMVLPIGTKVNLTMTMNLRTLFHIVNLRAKSDAQWEIRELTDKLIAEAKKVAPISIEVFEGETPMRIAP